MLRSAAFASSVVASTATVLPLSNPAAASRCCTHVKTARWLSRSMARRVRESSNDQAAARPPAAAESCVPPTSRSRARQSHVPSRSLQSSRPAATGSNDRARGSAVPSPVRRTWRTGLRQTDRSRRRPAAHSAAYRRGAPATLAAPQSRPTTTLAHSVGFPSPSATLYYCQSILAILRFVTDFHHGLLGIATRRSRVGR